MTAVSEVMTRNPFTVDAHAALKGAHQAMIEKGFRHVPVLDGEAIKGLLSARDIHLAMLANAGTDSMDSLKVDDVYDISASVVVAQTDVKKVAAMMAEQKIGAVLVEEDGKLGGIITATDICRIYSQS